jgi:hypothetical protein
LFTLTGNVYKGKNGVTLIKFKFRRKIVALIVFKDYLTAHFLLLCKVDQIFSSRSLEFRKKIFAFNVFNYYLAVHFIIMQS